jgi:N-acetylneuraminic acid mutarotase
LIFGGTDQHQIFNDLWEFDLKSKTWKEIKLKNASPRCGHVSFSENETFYNFGGIGEKETIDPSVMLIQGKESSDIPYDSIFTNVDTEDSLDLFPGLIHSTVCVKNSNLYICG